MNTALVTGGNGFVGAAIIRRLLQAGHTVHATVHRNHNVLDALLPQSQIHILHDKPDAAAELVTSLSPDAVFHLAAHSSAPKTLRDMTDMLDRNLTLGTSLLHGATLCPTPPVFLNAGTYWQFADPAFSAPNTFYAATKQAFHDILLYFRRTFPLPAATLVLYDTIGPSDTRPKLWNTLAAAPPGSVIPLSAGEQQIDLTHVDDIARAFLHAATLLAENPQHLPESLYALRSGHTRTLRQFLESLQQSGILNLRLHWGELPYSPAQIFTLWPGKQLPGWTPAIDVSQTIAEMTRDYVRSAEQPTTPCPQ